MIRAGGEMGKEKFKYSIIVPFYNEERVLKNFLDSVVALEEPQGDFEVIFVDHNSTDKSAEIIKSYGNKILNLTLVNETKKGIGTARKCGARLAKGEIFVTSDADVSLPSDFLKSIGGAFEKSEKIVGVVGLYEFIDKSKIFNLFWQSAMIFFDYINRIITGTFAFRGLVSASKRDPYFACGEFNSNISALEDVELSLRLKKLGKIKYATDIRVLTSYRRFKGRFVRQLIKRLKAYFFRAILRDNKSEADWEIVR